MLLRQGVRWCRIQTIMGSTSMPSRQEFRGICAFAARVPLVYDPTIQNNEWNLCLRGKGFRGFGVTVESMPLRQGFH